MHLRQTESVAYRDELEALRARLAQAEADRDRALDRVRALETGDDGRAGEGARFDPSRVSIPGGEPTTIALVNRSPRKVELYWLSYDGRERRAGTLVSGGSTHEETYVGVLWRFVDATDGRTLEEHRVEPAEREIHFDG